MAEAIAAKHGAASRAVLFYGSCLREKQLDGLMLDFYLIVSDYRAAYGKRWLATANRLIPPNVFYFEHDGLAAKYAVLSEADFHRLNGPETRNVSVWARFAQPSRLVWAADDAARASGDRCGGARGADACLRRAPADAEARDPLDLVAARFRADLFGRAARRAHRPQRHRSSTPTSNGTSASPNRRIAADPTARWLERRAGRAGGSRARCCRCCGWPRPARPSPAGVEYIAWKINRHAGTEIEIKPWQRRWPLLAAISLLPRLLRSGAVR